MEAEYYLKDELKRLNRMNELFEKNIIQCKIYNNEPEQIVRNVNAMCEIANTLDRLI